MKKLLVVFMAVILLFSSVGISVVAEEIETVDIPVDIQLFRSKFENIPDFKLDVYQNDVLFIERDISLADIVVGGRVPRVTLEGLPKHDDGGELFVYDVKLSSEVEHYSSNMTRYSGYRHGLQLTFIPYDEIINYEGEYDGEPHTITHNDIPNDVLSVHYRYYKEDDSKPVGDAGWNEKMPTFTDAGTYIVESTINYFGGTVIDREGFVKITPKPVEIKVDDKTKLYTADDPELTGSVIGLISEGDLGTVEYYIEYHSDSLPIEPDMTYIEVIKAKYTENQNYKIAVELGDMTIEPDVITEEIITTEDEIPFETIYEDDNTLEKGKEIVKTEGIKGKETITVVITYTNGVETNRIETEEIINPVDKVILRGTKTIKPTEPTTEPTTTTTTETPTTSETTSVTTVPASTTEPEFPHTGESGTPLWIPLLLA
ncbi:MAG: hypothetical protein GX038_07310, partial [Erysipelothrix sp.]|nr:hypothetical protein [Erysipelothrix sp.]